MVATSTSNSMLRIWYIMVGIWVLHLFQQFWFLDSDGFVDVFDPTRLIFVISMGEQAKESKLVERFVWSARHRGQWSGYILLLTDAPLDRYEGFSHRFLVTNPEARHFNTTFKDDMTYKRFKTFAIDYVDKDPRLNQVELIYYLDVDNIVGNSLPNMFNDLESKYNIPISSSSHQYQHDKWLRTIPRMWFFANKYTHLSVQGGQFVVDRQFSGPCLKAWRDKIDANVSEPKDQPALHKIRGNGRNQDCQIVTMLPKIHLFFPANSTIHKGTYRTVRTSKTKTESVCLPEKSEACRVVCVSRGASHPFSHTCFFPILQNLFRIQPTAVDQIKSGEVMAYPTLVHIKNSCNVTASIDAKVEEAYVQDIVRNPEFSKKIHVKPDQ